MTNFEKIGNIAVEFGSVQFRDVCNSLLKEYNNTEIPNEALCSPGAFDIWLNSKYEEPFPDVDWSKVEQGTPIQVWDGDEWEDAFFVCTYKGYIMAQLPDDHYLYKCYNDAIEAYNYEHGRLVE